MGLRFEVSAVVAISFCLFAGLSTPSVAAPTAKDQAIASYNAGKTAEAVAKLKEVLKAQPSDGVAHYYLGMCYQKLNQKKNAIAEYQWITTNSKDSGLFTRAAQGLAGLGVTPPAPPAQAAGLPTVIDFSAEWCVPCKKFAPLFDRVAAAYKGRAAFLHIDVDKPGGRKALVDKYNPQVMPTIVFQDGAGRARVINEGVMDEPSLVQQVESLLK